MSNHVLIIEDNEDIQELVKYNLKKNGYTTSSAISGEEGIKMVSTNQPDLILLDLMLPGIDGFEVCKKIKSIDEAKTIPVIMLTAKGEDTDIVSGFEIGADDYVTKPFSPSVLIARVKSALRKTKVNKEEETGSIIKVDDLLIHPKKHEIRIHGKVIDLTSTEFKLLHLLAQRPGWAYSRYQIVSAIRGDDYSVTDRAVDVSVVGLRKKLGDEYGHFIETVRGVGYRFKEKNV